MGSSSTVQGAQLFDDLEGCDEEAGETQEGGDICMQMDDSLPCIAVTNITL